MLELSSSVVIKPHPRSINAQEPQIMPRYVPMRVTETPEITEVKAAPNENGIILKSMSGDSEQTAAPSRNLT